MIIVMRSPSHVISVMSYLILKIKRHLIKSKKLEYLNTF